MTRRRQRRPASGTGRGVPRTERLNPLLQEIVAEELERIDDDRLGMLTVVGVDVDGDLGRAAVFYTTLAEDEADDQLREALEQHRPRLQSAIASQARIRRTPELTFVPDAVTRQAERLEDILREMNPTSDGDS